MNFLQFVLYFFITLLLSSSTSKAQYRETRYDHVDVDFKAIALTITVDKSGSGNFTTVQQAINFIPSGNKLWTLIHLKAGTYVEKISIPVEKPFILLQGENRGQTVIQWSDAGQSLASSTFTVLAENFIAMNITFKNTYNKALVHPSVNKMTWAPAAKISGDKCSFYNCAFISLQDTLTDFQGRHFFKSCYIEGAVDFIWGYGQSIYQDCAINVTTSALAKTAYITAQGRNSTQDTSGYVFKQCVVTGTGPAYLGRAWGKYSRVIYYKSDFTDIIVPAGWSDWNYNGFDGLITYAEEECSGAGSVKSNRVKWEKKTLPPEDLKYFTNPATFLSQDGWLEGQPIIL